VKITKQKSFLFAKRNFTLDKRHPWNRFRYEKYGPRSGYGFTDRLSPIRIEIFEKPYNKSNYYMAFQNSLFFCSKSIYAQRLISDNIINKLLYGTNWVNWVNWGVCVHIHISVCLSLRAQASCLCDIWKMEFEHLMDNWILGDASLAK
jgi:hypothetical protein